MRGRAITIVCFLALLTSAVCRAAGPGLDSVLKSMAVKESAYLDELKELVSIPSVSASPTHQPDILRAADWLVARLQRAGLHHVAILQNPQGPRPAVYADYLVSASLPTALVYGHYDVQPADPMDAWTSPPFSPEVRGEALYGRGASDDKGGLLSPVQALEAMLAADGTLPLNVKVLLEGEEEIGSPYLDSFLQQHRELLRCDFVLSADGGQISATQPGIALGLRGAAALEIEVAALRRDVHSGMVGGAVQNSARALVQLLATLHDPATGRVLVDGFYKSVVNVSDADRGDILALNYDEQVELVEALGAVEAVGEAGYSSLERIWHRPTLELVGVSGGFSGDGIKTVIPATSVAKLAARLVPDQRPEEILELIEAHLQRHHPPACNVTIRELGFKAAPFVTRRDSPVIAAAAKVLEQAIGKAPLFERGGATIPALAAFQKHLGAETVVFGFALPGDAVHAPDERYQLSQYSVAREAYARLLYELGSQAQAKAAVSKEAAGAAAEAGSAGSAVHTEL